MLFASLSGYLVNVFTISQAIGSTLTSVLVALATGGVLALLRLLTPGSRWSRRLKLDGEIHAALPDGKEKAFWAASVAAQAERLRIYREDFSIRDQILGWYAFSVVATAPAALIWDAAHGWPSVTLMTGGDPWLAVPGALVLLLNYVFALVITARLIGGRSTLLTAGSGGHYPKHDTLRRAERRRKAKRSAIERRLARLQSEQAEVARSRTSSSK